VLDLCRVDPHDGVARGVPPYPALVSRTRHLDPVRAPVHITVPDRRHNDKTLPHPR
jgi:hypothetical protein